MIEVPKDAIRDCIKASGVAAVYVACGSESCRAGATHDLSNVIAKEKAEGRQIIDAFWVKDRLQAKRVLAVMSTRHGDHDALRVEIAEAARRLGVAATEHQAVMKRAREVTERVRREVMTANRDGRLAWFNSGYKAYRAASKAPRPMSYRAAQGRLCRALTRRLMTLGQCDPADESLLAEVLPDLSMPICKNGAESS